MKQLQIKDYDSEWKIGIDKVKIIKSSNVKAAYRFHRTLSHVLGKEDVSEFETESQQTIEVIIDQKRIDSKYLKFYLMSPQDSINDELKTSAKTLASDYLEVKLKDIEYSDEFNQINQSMQFFASEIYSQSCVELEDVSLNFEFVPLSTKLLIKLTEPYLLKEEMRALDYDLDLREKLSIYFKIIAKIVDAKPQTTYIIALNLDILDEFAYKLLSVKCEHENLHILCFVGSIQCLINYKDLYTLGHTNLDWSDDETLYNQLVIEKGLYSDMSDLYQDLTIKFSDPIETSKLIQLFA